MRSTAEQFLNHTAPHPITPRDEIRGAGTVVAIIAVIILAVIVVVVVIVSFATVGAGLISQPSLFTAYL